MVTLPANDRPFQIPDEMVRAVARHAEHQADLTAAYLNGTGLFKSKRASLPRAFLLELAAVLELGVWERCDHRRHLSVDLPTYREAAGMLAARADKGPSEFDGPDATPLSLQVLRVWIEHFAWDGSRLMSADVVVGSVDEDAFIDVLAEFVWRHRRELTHLIRQDEQQL